MTLSSGSMLLLTILIELRRILQDSGRKIAGVVLPLIFSQICFQLKDVTEIARLLLVAVSINVLTKNGLNPRKSTLFFDTLKSDLDFK